MLFYIQDLEIHMREFLKLRVIGRTLEIEKLRKWGESIENLKYVRKLKN